ncbi:MAG: hypothetical protein LUM44_23505 [Pyrinomonadaceae bacterium]|nr:hypothetical protein [Pyrinomonadaceae bacterium]
MNERLQKKIDEIKKNLKENEYHPLLAFDTTPRKIEVELPYLYEQYSEQLLKLIELREKAVKDLKRIPPNQIPQFRTVLKQMDETINDLETKLAEQYQKAEREQLEQLDIDEVTEYQDQITEELFIMVRHLKPHLFEQFKEYVFANMEDDEIAEQLEIIARREETELEEILAGEIQQPEYICPHLKRLSPYDLFTWELNNIAFHGFNTDEMFKDWYKSIESLRELRMRLIMEMYQALPVLRRRIDAKICEIESKVRMASEALQEYFIENRNNGKFTHAEKIEDKYYDERFESLDRYRVQVFIAEKHLKPDTFPEFEKYFIGQKTDEEKAIFYQKVAEVDEREIGFILEAVQNEIY